MCIRVNATKEKFADIIKRIPYNDQICRKKKLMKTFTRRVYETFSTVTLATHSSNMREMTE